jgi:hypothetical protein
MPSRCFFGAKGDDTAEYGLLRAVCGYCMVANLGKDCRSAKFYRLNNAGFGAIQSAKFCWLARVEFFAP